MPKSKDDLNVFASTANKGFRMTFNNGITGSVQWGPGNYCGARSYSVGSYDAPMRTPSQCWDSDTAEVAAFDKDGNWVTKEIFPDECDDVKGWLTPDEVIVFLCKCALLKRR